MKAFSTLLLICISFSAFSQQSYFILIEEEKSQPFYIRMDERTFSSSPIGHLILPQLKDSSYRFFIGFPKNQIPEQEFIVKMNRKDHGFQLKNLGQKGWALFDLQSLELILPVPKQNGLSNVGYSLVRKYDGFAKLMSEVVNDTAVLYGIVYDKPVETIVKKEPEIQKSIPVDSSSLTKTDINSVKIDEEKDLTIKSKSDPDTLLNGGDTKIKSPKSVVTKVENGVPLDSLSDKKIAENIIVKTPSEVKSGNNQGNDALKTISIRVTEQKFSDSGLYMMVEDGKNKIDIFISNDPVLIKEAEVKKEEAPKKTEIKKEEEPTKPIIIDKQENDKLNTKKEDKKIENPIQADQKKDSVNTTPKRLVLMNSDCRSFATDMDVDKLRVKMINEKDEDEKIALARKLLRSKCFTAHQVRALTELFQDNNGKYKFLDASYPFVSDTGNFKQLVSVLTDEYYVKRFKTMVRMD